MVQNRVVYSQLYEILKQLDKSYVMKIPIEFLDKIKKEKLEDYTIEIDWSKPLEEQNLEKDTINILGYFNENYWLDESEKKTLKEKENLNSDKDEIGDKIMLKPIESIWNKIKKFISKFLRK